MVVMIESKGEKLLATKGTRTGEIVIVIRTFQMATKNVNKRKRQNPPASRQKEWRDSCQASDTGCLAFIAMAPIKGVNAMNMKSPII